MSEYIIDWDENLIIDTFSKNSLHNEIVRCKDCEWAIADGYSCSRFDYYDVEPDGFCKWGEKETR